MNLPLCAHQSPIPVRDLRKKTPDAARVRETHDCARYAVVCDGRYETCPGFEPRSTQRRTNPLWGADPPSNREA